MEYFIHEFMECDEIPIQRTSKECKDCLQNMLGYSFEIARGVLGLAIAHGYVVVSAYKSVKNYN